jgi:acyl-CoA thioesterase
MSGARARGSRSSARSETVPMEYSELLASMRADRDGFVVYVDAGFMQGRTIFGGLQLALAVRAMRARLPAPLPLRSAQVTFVAPVPQGPVHLHSELLRTGNSATHARAELRAGSQVACVVVAIFGAARASTVAIDLQRPSLAQDPEQLPELQSIPGVTPAFIGRLQLRWARGRPPFSGHTEPRSSIFGRLRDRATPYEDAVIALADSIPTPALSMLKRPAPASSLNWMLELLADPAELDRDGWAQIETEVRAGAEGYLSQTSVLYAPNGKPLAISHQTVGIFG